MRSAVGGLCRHILSLRCSKAYPTLEGNDTPTSSLAFLRWASKKQGGSTQNRGGSLPKMLGVKLYGGQVCQPGSIIVRQRGTKVLPGQYVGMGRDHTLYALKAGRVTFHGSGKKSVSVSI